MCVPIWNQFIYLFITRKVPFFYSFVHSLYYWAAASCCALLRTSPSVKLELIQLAIFFLIFLHADCTARSFFRSWKNNFSSSLFSLHSISTTRCCCCLVGLTGRHVNNRCGKETSFRQLQLLAIEFSARSSHVARYKRWASFIIWSIFNLTFIEFQ